MAGKSPIAGKAALALTTSLAVIGVLGVPAASAETVLGECTVVDNPTPTTHTMCSGDNLGLIKSQGLDLSYAELDHTTVAGGAGNASFNTFVDADFTGATWFHVAVVSSDFTGATLDGSNFGSGLQTDATFIGAHIANADLTNGRWSGANFTGAHLSGSDFTGGQFGVDDNPTDFTGATLTGTNFDDSNLVPSDVAVSATSAAGANVSWAAPQSEPGEQLGTCSDVDGPVTSGDVFPIGTTTVTCEVVSTANSTFGTGTFTVRVNTTAPAFTSANATTFTVGQAAFFPVAATGVPEPTITETGALPDGVTFAAGVLSGTPAVGVGGTYPISFTASNGILPHATQSFTLTVDEAPGITSPDSATFTAGQPGSFSVTATGYPALSIAESGPLPDGVTFVAGVLSGTPAVGAGGTYPITITASNGVLSDATQDFTLMVDEAPAITSADTTTFTVGQHGTFTVTTTGFPASITKTGSLPRGVTFTANGDGTATLSGAPAATGRFPITITDSNTVGTAIQRFTLVVVAPLAITGRLPGGTVGVHYDAKLTATGGTLPYAWSIASGALPPGLSLATDGTVSGTPTTAGAYHVTIEVNDPATKAMTIVIAAAQSAAPSPAPGGSGPTVPAPSAPSPAPGGSGPIVPAPSAAPVPAAGVGGALAATGAGVRGAFGGAIALLLLGSGLLFASRRRRPHGSHVAD